MSLEIRRSSKWWYGVFKSEGRTTVLDVMKDLAHRGMTMIVVTHEMGFAREVARRVVFMDEGMVVEGAARDEFFTNPKTERAKAFLSKILVS